MTVDLLDFLDETPSTEKSIDPLGFLGEDVSKTRSLLSALPKGLIKGAATFSPLPNFGPVSLKGGQKLTEQFLPTRKGGVEDILEFTGEHAPAAALGEGGLVKKGLQALSGGLAKTGAKELNLPEWAQDIVGAAGMAVPGALEAAGTKSLRPSVKQQPIVDFLKSKGFSDKEITPIIQDPKMLSFLSKGALKYEKRNSWLKGIKDKIGNIYQDVREQGKKGGYLEGKVLENFEDQFFKKLDKIPKRQKKLIKSEVEDLFNNPIDFTELHDFTSAINDIVKDTTGGKAVIGIMKEPIREAQKKLNPSLFNDLRSADNAYSRMSNFSEKMTKKNWEGLINLGQTGGLLLGALTLNPAMLKIAGGTALGRFGVKQILTNPRLQNIHLKMWDAVLKNKMPQALKLLELFNKETEKNQEASSSK